jgi:iron complex outermembrane receptor protein
MSLNTRSPKPAHSFSKKILTRSIATALAATASGGLIAEDEKLALEEVVVTARQRVESSQEVPIFLTSLTGEQLQNLGVTTLADFSRWAPSVSVQSSSPGQNIIVFRGVSDGGGFLSDPTAAIYLDEQPMSVTSAAPDIYPVDIARIEALAGPQSTLFGASSQSGAVRIITNKPDLAEFGGDFGMELSDTKKGELGYKIDATVNIPLITDKLALRLVGFSARDGGYIDNVLGNTIYDERAPLSGQRDNANVVKDDINRVDWLGFRGHLGWSINDDWMATLSVNHQTIEAGGYNDYDPDVGDLETINFVEEERTDEWAQFSLVVEADLGFAQFVSATSYYDREIFVHYDENAYVSYMNAAWGSYGGYYSRYDFGDDPVGGSRETANFGAFTQEFRFSGESDRLQWTAGLFYQDSDDDYVFNAYAEDFANSPGFAARVYYDGIDYAPTDDWWESFQKTERTDMAVFGELDWSITDRLDIILGARWYDVEFDREFYVANPATGPRDYILADGSDDGFIPKIGLQYNVNDDVMFYALYSEGYRVGGANRERPGASLPHEYDSDILENSEIGLKSTWLDDRLLFNATYYHMTWDDTQMPIADPAHQAYYGTFYNSMVANVGDATVNGFDLDVRAILGDHVEIGLTYSNTIKAELKSITSVADERAVGDTFPKSGEPIEVQGQIPLGLDPIQQLPLYPDQSWSAYIEYSHNLSWFGGGKGYVRLQHSDTGESLTLLNETRVWPSYILDGYAVTDLKIGFSAADWSAQFFVDNLGDERGITYKSNYYGNLYGQNNHVVIRPRSMGISFRKSY